MSRAGRGKKRTDSIYVPYFSKRPRVSTWSSAACRNSSNRLSTATLNALWRSVSVARPVQWPGSRRSADPGRAEELFTLPNYRSIDDYKEPAQRLLARLPFDDPKFDKFRDKLRDHQRHVREVL